MATDYTHLRALLSNETFPHRYAHKFIGRNTEAFAESVTALEAAFPGAQRVAERRSQGQDPDGPHYIAYTYELVADEVEEIIFLLEATAMVKDLKMIL